MRFALPTVLALSMACAGAPSQPRADQPFPAIALPQLGGEPWSPRRAAGSVLVVDFWASWCKPCRKGFARLNQLRRQRPSIRMVAISLDESEEAVRSYLEEVEVAFPVALDLEQRLAAPPLAIRQIPTILVVDSDGVIRHRIEDPSESDYDRLPELVDAL